MLTHMTPMYEDTYYYNIQNCNFSYMCIPASEIVLVQETEGADLKESKQLIIIKW